MGKSRDGHVRLKFGDDKKITVRFSNEAQKLRVTALIEYIRVALKTGGRVDDLAALVQGDLTKATEVINKITRHEGGNSNGY